MLIVKENTMCLGVPCKVVKIDGDSAVVETANVKNKINISLVDNLCIGNYVIVHAGFAIEKIDEAIAKETLEMIRNVGG
ncbi:MAG: HypC/HybG/HupF family hydrogenase formation chaperone [Thermodesulfobacteriota bacterium]